MQLNIIYNKSFVLNNIDGNDKILKIKEMIHEKSKIPIEEQFLQCHGKVLMDDEIINDCKIKNNDMIFLSQELKGGNVAGFPDVGNLILLLGVSTIVLLLFNLFFSNIYNYFSSTLTSSTICPTDSNVNKELSQFSTQMCSNGINQLFQAKQGKLTQPIQKGGNFLSNNYQTIYNIATMFYSALFVIIMTIYLYTMYCNEGLSNWIIIGALSSLLMFFISAILSNDLIKDSIVSQNEVMYLMTIVAVIMSIGLFLATFIIPFVKKTKYLHWSTYLYPIGAVIAMIYLNYMNIRIANPFLNVINKIITVITLIFVPYIVAYIYNVHQMCG